VVRDDAGRARPVESGSAPAASSHGWARLLGASAAGWLLVGVGLGLGLPRLADGAVTASTVLGLGALVAGVGLLALAARLLLRATRGWARLVLVPWLAVLLIATYSLSIALAAALPRHPALDAGPPAELGAEEVAMVAADGVVLAGWLVPSRNGAAVVVRHGSGSTRADTLAHAAVLADAGYGVLITDARGHGTSGGRGMDLGWYGDADIAAAVDLLVSRPDVDPGRIAVLGLSMGGEEAIGAAATDDRIRAVVAEGATGRTAADKAWLSEEYGLAGVVQQQIDRITYGLTDLLSPASPPAALADAVAYSAPTSLLLIAAGEAADEALVAERLRASAPDRTEVWVVPGAGHVAGLSTDPPAWSGHVLGFLASELGASDSR
jgi:dienelactone hydrolase